jgi:hypothetical protein
VRIFDGGFWWPVSCGSDTLTPKLFASLVAENDPSIIGALGALTRHSSGLPTREEFAQTTAVRAFGTSTHDEVIAHLHRGASRTMFCDNQVYFQAGPPAFFRSQTRSEMFVGPSSLTGDDYGNDGFESIQIPGPDRHQRRQTAAGGEALGLEELSVEMKRLPGWSVLPDVRQKIRSTHDLPIAGAVASFSEWEFTHVLRERLDQPWHKADDESLKALDPEVWERLHADDCGIHARWILTRIADHALEEDDFFFTFNHEVRAASAILRRLKMHGLANDLDAADYNALRQLGEA